MTTSEKILPPAGIAIMLCMNAFSQTAGDEDREMFNRPRACGRKATGEAVNKTEPRSMGRFGDDFEPAKKNPG